MSIRSTGAVGSGRRRSNMPGPKEKSFAIPRPMVWEAWRRVKANKGSAGSGRGGSEGVPGRSEGQPLQDLESNELGVLLACGGQGGGDPQAARWRGPNAGRANDRGQGRADGASHASGGTGGPSVSPGLLWLPAGQIGS